MTRVSFSPWRYASVLSPTLRKSILLAASFAASQASFAAHAAEFPLPPVARSGVPLTEVAQFGEDFRLVGIAVTPEGRIFASAPANNVRSRYSVVEVTPKNGTLVPYPTKEWNIFSNQDGSNPAWINAQALWADTANHLWVLDSSLPTLDQRKFPPKLVEIDTHDNRVLRQYSFDGVVAPPDALNDVRIDQRHNFAYLTNAGNHGSLVVLDLVTGRARQVLAGSRSTRSDLDQTFIIHGQSALRKSGERLTLHADGIALSPDSEWLYYRPLTDHHYWRLPTAALRDESLNDEALDAKVEDLGQSVESGGLIMDAQGTLIGGDLEHRTIVAMALAGSPPRLETHILASDPRLSWADGFAISKGYLYVADSRLWEVAFKNGYARSGPFAIYKLRLPANK